jgi:hypothetical protein
MLKSIGLVCACIVALAGEIVAADFAVKEEAGKHIDISYKGRLLTRFMTARDDSTPELTHDTYKTYMHVVDPLDPKAERFITKGPGGKFTHHRGIFIGFSKAKVGEHGGDWWHCRNDERLAYTSILEQDAKDDQLRLVVGVNWVKGDIVCLSEKREFVIHKPAEDGAFLIEQISHLTAVAGDAELKGDPEHAGCQFRPHNDVSLNQSAKYLAAGNAEVGNKGQRDIPWVAESFKLYDNDYLIQHMSSPDLPKGTIYSAYRDYGRFGVYWVDSIPKGETHSYRFGFYISPGTLPSDPAPLQARWESFSGQ